MRLVAGYEAALAFHLPRSTFDKVLLLLGGLALLCISPIGTVLAVVAAISIIGLPIALVMAAIPALFVLLLVARLIHASLAVVGIRLWPLSGALALGLLALIPWIENRRLDSIAQSMAGDDVTALDTLPKIATLAVLNSAGESRVCDDFCQRALLNGVASEVIMARNETPQAAPADGLAGTAYRLERRQECPPFDLSDGMNSLKLATEERKYGDKTAADLLRLKTAQGICLIAEDVTLSRADPVIARGRVRHGQSDFAAGLNPFADTVSAERLSLYRREGGQLVERYRATGVTYFKLLPVLAVSYVGGYGLELAPGFLRRAAFVGDAEKYRPAPAFEPFLEKTLGFDLALRDGEAEDSRRDIISQALDRPGPVDRPVAKVIADFFEDFSRRNDRTAVDAELAVRVLRDHRVPVPRAAAAPVRKFAAENGEIARQFAEALFGRLPVTSPDEREDHPTFLGYTLGYLAAAIAALPDEAIRPHRDGLELLARNPEARVKGYVALTRLSVFGADAVPTLIYLIDDAAAYKNKSDRDAWQHPYLAGLQGLCRIGDKGLQAVPMIYKRLDSGVMVKFSSYWDLTINTLVGLGADPEEMWTHLQTSDQNQTRGRFDRNIERARRERDCSY